MATLWAHMYDPPPSVADLRPDLPPAVDQALGKALAKVPQNRFASCGEFADSLRSALGVASYPLAPRQPPFGPAPPPVTPVSRGPVTTSMARGTNSATTRAGGTGAVFRAPSAPAGHRARRPRNRRIAAAAIMAVLAAGAVVASMMLLSPGAGTGTGSAASGHSATSPASRAATATASHSGVATLTGSFTDPGSTGIQALALGDSQGTPLVTVDNNDHVYAFHKGSRSPASSLSLASLGAGGSLLTPLGAMLVDPDDDCVTGTQTTCGYTLLNVATGHTAGPVTMDNLLEGVANGTALTAAGDSAEVEVLDPVELLAHLVDPDHDRIAGAAIRGDGQVVVTSSGASGATHTEYVWNAGSRTVTTTLTAPVWAGVGQNPVAGVSYLSAALDELGNTLALSDGSKTYIYSLPTGRLISVVPAVAEALNDEGTLLATLHSGRVQLWDVQTAHVIATLTTPASAGKAAAIAFNYAGNALGVACDNGTTYVWTISQHVVTP